MALRTTSDLTVAPRSATVGQVVTVSAKVENTASAPASLVLAAEGADLPGAFEPASVEVPAKSRARVEFSWNAALPEGERAKTYRGKLVLRSADGKLVGSAPLDLYVAQS